jgi:hypothetical protein
MAQNITDIIPILITPFNNQIAVKDIAIFQWLPVKDAENYIVQVANDSYFTNAIECTVVEPTVKIMLKTNSSYYWRVQARNSSSISKFSKANFFRTFQDVSNLSKLLSKDFDINTMYVEYSVNDFSKNQLYFDILSFEQYNSNDLKSIMVDVKRNLIESNFYIQSSTENAGSYLVKYTVFKNIIGSAFKKALQITQISSTRKEVKFILVDDSQAANFKDYPLAYVQAEYPIDFYLNGENDVKYKIINALLDTDNTLIVKLEQELSEEMNEGLSTWISRKMSKTTEEGVILTPSKRAPIPKSIEPDFTNYKKNVSSATGKESYTTLVPQQLTQSLNLGAMILSASSIVGSTLNIDFTDYSNYVTFGSAQGRLDAFISKLKNIENYSASINTLQALNSSESIATVNHINYLTTQISTLISQFDLYEKFLYTETASMASGSGGVYDGQWTDFCYPKSSPVYPYRLEQTTSPIASAWYTTQSVYMNFYDNNNPNTLTRTIPEYILEDELNKDYITFIKMIGHYYDNIYIYLKNFLSIYDKSNDIYQGYPKEITYWIGKSIGKELYNDNINADLINYYLGQNISGSSIYTSGSSYPLNANEMTVEIWKRLITSYPHIQKTKGTAQAIKAIMSCYGIPSTLLRIKEYGGHSELTGSLSQEYIYEDFSYVADFNSGSYSTVYVPWKTSSNGKVPDTIQFRFACPSEIISLGSGATIVYAYSSSIATHAWSVGISSSTAGSAKPNVDSGFVYFKISGSSTILTSSNMNIFDGSYYTVQLTRATSSDASNITQSFYLDVAKTDSSRFLVQSTTSMSVDYSASVIAYISASMLAIGNYDSGQFCGTLDEFRIWNKPITNDIFNYYVKQPSALVGTSISSSRDDLIFRLSFDYPQNLTTASFIYNESYNPVYCVSASSSGWENSIAMPYQYKSVVRDNITYVPNAGYSKFESNKVRIESNRLLGNSVHTDIQNEIGEFDSNAIESNRLGIFFSPIDIINEQIVQHVGPISVDDLIGTPDDWLQPQYNAMELTRNFIYSYVPLYSFYEYLSYISLYNKTVFDSLRDYIPAYVNPTIGVLIESDILDRDKVQIFKSSSMEDEVKNAEFDVRTNIIITGDASSRMNISASIDFNSYSIVTGDINNNYTASYSFSIIATSSRQEFTIPGGDFTGGVIILMDANLPAIEPVYTTYTLYQSDNVKLTTNDMNLGIPGFPTYDPTHYRYIGNFRTSTQNMKYAGCKITGLIADMVATSYANIYNDVNPVQIFNVSKNTVLIDANNKTFTQ